MTLCLLYIVNGIQIYYIDNATVFVVRKPFNQHRTSTLVRYRIFTPRDKVNSHKYAIVTTKKTTNSTVVESNLYWTVHHCNS